MPVQIWTPTAPNADSAALGLGIAGAGRSLGRALEKIGEEHKRNATQAKAVETFLSTLPEDQLPMDLQAFKNLSAKEKIGVGMGLLQGQQFRNSQQEGQVNLARLAEINQRMQTQQAETANAAKSPAFLSALSRYRQPTLEAMPAGVEGPPNQVPGLDALSAAGRASEETGFQVPPTALARILDEIGQSEGGNSLFTGADLGKLRPTELPGVHFMPTSRGGGQVVTDPTQPQRPGAAKPTDEGMIEIPDPDDPIYGPRIRIPVSVARSQYPHLLKRLETGKPGAAAPDGASNNELKLAQDAIAAGRDRKKVAAQYKQRTGKDLPP